jgi:hypothetical protein
MALSRLIVALLPALAWATDEHVSLPAHGRAEAHFVLTAADVRRETELWIQADPNQVEVAIVDLQGRSWTQGNSNTAGAVQVQLADRNSGSVDEVDLATLLGSNGTLISFGRQAAAGTYRIQLSGAKLAAAADIVLQRTTTSEIIQALKRRDGDPWAETLAVPERKSPIGTSGKATATIESQRWDSQDALHIGTSFEKKFAASVKMPDGTTITEANAARLGCQWKWESGRGMLAMIFLKAAMPHLGVICPQHMREGTISVSVDAGAQSKPGELSVAVVSAKKLEAAFDKDLQQIATPRSTVQLIHKVDEKAGDQQGFVDARVGRPIEIRMAATNTDRIAAIAVKAEVFALDQKKDPGIMIVGPHDSKSAISAAATVARKSDGTFVYSFTPTRSAVFQADFTAEGQFTGGRRFTASSGVRVFAHPLAASVTSIRQQRFDTDNDGIADVVKFIVELEVARAGRYSVRLQFGGAAVQSGVNDEQELAAGKGTITLEGGPKFLALLNLRSEERLQLFVTSHAPRTAGEFPGMISIDTPLPKAGTFTTGSSVRGETRASTVSWKLVGTDPAGFPARLAVSVPLSASGSNCEAVAWLELNSPGKVSLIRTVGYQQRVAFVPVAGKARIEPVWDLAPFFANGAARSLAEGFMFRVIDVRCGAQEGWVADRSMRENDNGRGKFYLKFVADLSKRPANTQDVRGSAAASREPDAVPRVISAATVQPLDTDHDGKYDHLKIDFDLLSLGGRCRWSGSISAEEKDGATYASGSFGSAAVQPGISRVSMTLDVVNNAPLNEHRFFSFIVDGLTCRPDGVTNDRAGDEKAVSMIHQFEQKFAIDPGNFAKRGEIQTADFGRA